MGIDISNIKYCYDTLKSLRLAKSSDLYQLGRHLGYLEAYLESNNILETVKKNGINCIKCNTIKGNKWWKRDREESIEESIIRQTEKLLTDN